ncbi:MAG: hypothetical protein A2X36_16035 [Elusimicrobia bacterium GWA2_69_24]|nr:MAG: hypothetical protein A2X36_16035 [Elusimicrobia bacterium GWA2_69_24]HBL16614.1 hypothetical protein [Elusimicrobiota bacterium]
MSDASDLLRKHRLTTPAVTFAARSAYVAVWLSLAWSLALFAHMGKLGIARGGLGERVAHVLLALGLHALAVTGIRPSLERLWLPDNRRVFAAAAGLILLSLPAALAAGPLLGISAALLIFASVLCVRVNAASAPERDPAENLYAALSAALGLFLVAAAVAGFRDVPKTELYGWSIGTEEAAAAARRRQTPDEAMFTMRRLSPRSIGAFPRPVAAELRDAGCTVPQSAFESRDHNFFSAPLQDPRRFDWAVLCSRGTDTAIHVVWADPKAPGACPSELARVNDKDHLLEVGKGRLGYSRLIRPAQQGFLLNRDLSPDEAALSLPLGVLGIEDESVDRESRVHYCIDGVWVSVTGVRRFGTEKRTAGTGEIRGAPMPHELHGNPIQ